MKVRLKSKLHLALEDNLGETLLIEVGFATK